MKLACPSSMANAGEDTLHSRLSALRKLALIRPTVADIKFRTRMRGFDPDEVHAFIGDLAADYERAVSDLECVKKELDIVREEASKTRPFPDTTTRELEQILAGGTRVAHEIREKAEQEREAVIAAAHTRAAGIIRAAEHRATVIAERAAEAAEEVRKQVEEERKSIIAAADSRAAEIVRDAEDRAGEIVEHAADASRASDEIREQAEKERRSIIDAAQSRGDELVKDAKDRAHGIVAQAEDQATLLAKQAETLRAQLWQIRANFEAAASAATSAIGAIAELGDEQDSRIAEVSQPH